MIELMRHTNGLLFDRDNFAFASNYLEKFPNQAELVARFSLDLSPTAAKFAADKVAAKFAALSTAHNTSAPQIAASANPTPKDAAAMRQRVIKLEAEIAALKHEKMQRAVSTQIALYNKIYSAGAK